MANIQIKKFALMGFIAALLAAGVLWGYKASAYVPPVANAGPNQYITSSQYNSSPTVTLQGSGYDPNGGTINFYWACTGGYLSNANIAQPIYTAPSNTSQNTSYTCSLTVTNNYGLSSSSSMTVFINSNNNTSNFQVQTNSATDITNTQATLAGQLLGNNIYSGASYVWFQWGTSSSYGSESFHTTMNYPGYFSQGIASLASNTTYHFRAVAQTSSGQVVYGQDMTFYTSVNGQTYNNSYNNSSNNSYIATITKRGINLSSGNLVWSNFITATPLDVLKFQITIQFPVNQTLNNVVVRDVLPSGLVYYDNLIVTGVSYSNYGDITSGLSLGTIQPNQIVTISYQAQVASASNFTFGTTTLNNSVSLQSNETGFNNATSNVAISVNKISVLGAATSVSTGVAGNFFTESFFLPLLIIISGIWGIVSFKKRYT